MWEGANTKFSEVLRNPWKSRALSRNGQEGKGKVGNIMITTKKKDKKLKIARTRDSDT